MGSISISGSLTASPYPAGDGGYLTLGHGGIVPIPEDINTPTEALTSHPINTISAISTLTGIPIIVVGNGQTSTVIATNLPNSPINNLANAASLTTNYDSPGTPVTVVRNGQISTLPQVVTEVSTTLPIIT